MKLIKIDLSDPFETVLARVLAAPTDVRTKSRKSAEPGFSPVSLNQRDPELISRTEIKRVVRCLYEAAHGRQVETSIGLVRVAPPVAAFLKHRPLYIKTQLDFLLAALTRIIEISSGVSEQPPVRNRGETFRRPSRLTQNRSSKAMVNL